MSASPLTKMTFFKRFVTDILAGTKVITIRDESENNYAIGSIVDVSTFEDNEWFCRLQVNKVEPILFDDLTEYHATQENMTLTELKEIISDIYPGIKQLWVISYQLINDED